MDQCQTLNRFRIPQALESARDGSLDEWQKAGAAGFLRIACGFDAKAPNFKRPELFERVDVSFLGDSFEGLEQFGHS